MHLFGHWAKNFQKFVLLCSAVPWRNLVFFYNCFPSLIGKVCTFEIINCLGCINSVLRVVRKVLGKKFCSKNSIFVKNLPAFERKIFWLLAKLFPAMLSTFHSTFAEEGFRENFLEKEVFFIVFRLGAKTRLLKKHQVECENFNLHVRRKFCRKNINF